MKITTTAKKIAERSMDAYSADRYSSWSAVAQVLLNRGYNEAETEEIMRSKWTRWAADKAGKSERCSSTAIITWLDATFDMSRDKETTAVQKELMAHAVVR